MQMLDSKDTVDQLAKASSARLYGHVLRMGEDDIPRKSLDIRVKRTRESSRQKRIRLQTVVCGQYSTKMEIRGLYYLWQDEENPATNSSMRPILDQDGD